VEGGVLAGYYILQGGIHHVRIIEPAWNNDSTMAVWVIGVIDDDGSDGLGLRRAAVLGVLLAEPHHGHFELDHEELDLALLDELREGLQHAVLLELLRGEEQALGGEVADGPVEHLQREQLLDQRVVLQQRVLERGQHAVLVHQPALPREVLVDDREDGEDVALAGGVLEELVVDAEDGDEEFAGEGEVELGVFSDELSDEGERVQHAELDALVVGVVLPR